MARKKKPKVVRTPEEHRLYVEELDRKQRERSAAEQKTRPPKRKRTRNKPKSNKPERIYDVDRHARE